MARTQGSRCAGEPESEAACFRLTFPPRKPGSGVRGLPAAPLTNGTHRLGFSFREAGRRLQCHGQERVRLAMSKEGDEAWGPLDGCKDPSPSDLPRYE